MQLKRYFQTITAAVALLCTAPAFADLIVGSPADADTGNCFPFGCIYSGEYQQVYTAGAFSGPITINDLEFFNTSSLNRGATSTPSGTWTISLSTTSADWNTLSSTFASNIGGDNTMVFSGNLSQPWSFGDTLQINLSTPFTYDPGNGNLLMDVTVSGSSPGAGGDIFFDTNGFNGGAMNGNTFMGRVWNLQDVNTVNSGYGLVTGFSTVAAIPEPEIYAMMGIGLALMGFVARLRNKRQENADA